MGMKLLDQVRGAIRTRHYSRRTEEAYVHWIRRYIVFHGKRHPAQMAAKEIDAFRHAGQSWAVIVEPDEERQLLVVVTAYPEDQTQS